MSWIDLPKPLLAIVGPTAVGKTRLSIEVAERLNGEIVSADSRYFYRGMNIGTAKPTLAEMKSVRHHLIDIANPDETWSLAKFQAEAQQVIADIQHRSKLPILVGGTGQYVYAVLQSWSMPAQERDDHLREILENEVRIKRKDILYAYLEAVDPQAAARIDPRNVRRTLRAVEVILRSGRRFSEQRRMQSSPYSQKIIGLKMDRKTLYARIDARIDQMMQSGFVQEVQGLMEKGYSADLSSMSAIGYREICRVLNGEISLEEAVILMKRNTREYVRRQANWFKESDESIHWFEADCLDIAVVLAEIQSKEGWQVSEKEGIQ